MALSAFDRILQSAGPQNTPSQTSPDGEDSNSTDKTKEGQSQKLPPGVVLGKDRKPCRSCTSSAAWMAMMKGATKKPAKTAEPLPTPVIPDDCPPDVDELGRSTWTMLHSMAANYPTVASPSMQYTMKQFISTFSKLYPCWVCAEDFRAWMKEPGNAPKVEGQDELGMWMCEAHNVVNVKLGKPEFDCNLWKQRWKDGWKDGRCD